jgi:hypothetical protein
MVDIEFINDKIRRIEDRRRELDEVYYNIKRIIDTLQEGNEKQSLRYYQSLIGLIENVCADQSITLSLIVEVREMIKVLWKKTLGEKEVQLPYEVTSGESLTEKVEDQEKYKPAMKWVKRDLEDKARDTEERKGG